MHSVEVEPIKRIQYAKNFAEVQRRQESARQESIRAHVTSAALDAREVRARAVEPEVETSTIKASYEATQAAEYKAPHEEGGETHVPVDGVMDDDGHVLCLRRRIVKRN